MVQSVKLEHALIATNIDSLKTQITKVIEAKHETEQKIIDLNERIEQLQGDL